MKDEIDKRTPIQKQIEYIVTNGKRYFTHSKYREKLEKVVEEVRIEAGGVFEPFCLKICLGRLEYESANSEEERKEIFKRIARVVIDALNLSSRMDLNESGYSIFFDDGKLDEMDREIKEEVRGKLRLGLLKI